MCCDEDIFNKMLSVADEQYKNKQPFFNFVMTTSNHRPYTYPSGKVDIPSGKGRAGAVWWVSAQQTSSKVSGRRPGEQAPVERADSPSGGS